MSAPDDWMPKPLAVTPTDSETLTLDDVSPAVRALRARHDALVRLLRELAAECEERADCSIEVDGSERPNFAMTLLVKIRAVVPE